VRYAETGNDKSEPDLLLNLPVIPFFTRAPVDALLAVLVEDATEMVSLSLTGSEKL
jgi:hypothetical protein